MKLYKDEKAFRQAIAAASRYTKIDPSLVEKDYFITLFLQELKKRVPELLFKGGTSLSKCHKIIDRFSEDIDLTLTPNHQTQGQKKQLKQAIVDTCIELGLKLVNETDIKSRRDYNCYQIEYPIMFSSMAVKPLLLVETVFIQKAYPDEVKSVSSIIGDWLMETNNVSATSKYELESFNIRVQTLERTLIDKVFALCDYMLDNNIERQSRHIYDISQLLSKVELNANLKMLVQEVRQERKSGVKSLSAKDGVDVQALIKEIIDEHIYEKDYNTVTKLLLSKVVEYEDAIQSLETIYKREIF